MTVSDTELLDRERLHIFQQFILNRESDEIREELYEYMIMNVIFRHSQDGKLEKSKILTDYSFSDE